MRFQRAWDENSTSLLLNFLIQFHGKKSKYPVEAKSDILRHRISFFSIFSKKWLKSGTRQQAVVDVTSSDVLGTFVPLIE
jgi:hypothetical protein